MATRTYLAFSSFQWHADAIFSDFSRWNKSNINRERSEMLEEHKSEWTTKYASSICRAHCTTIIILSFGEQKGSDSHPNAHTEHRKSVCIVKKKGRRRRETRKDKKKKEKCVECDNGRKWGSAVDTETLDIQTNSSRPKSGECVCVCVCWDERVRLWWWWYAEDAISRQKKRYGRMCDESEGAHPPKNTFYR